MNDSEISDSALKRIGKSTLLDEIWQARCRVIANSNPPRESLRLLIHHDSFRELLRDPRYVEQIQRRSWRMPPMFADMLLIVTEWVEGFEIVIRE